MNRRAEPDYIDRAAKVIADFNACGHCEGTCGTCRGEAEALDAAGLLVTPEVERLTAENARLREEVRSLQRSSQRNADAHMVTHREYARLRNGISHARWVAEVNENNDTRTLHALLDDIADLLNERGDSE